MKILKLILFLALFYFGSISVTKSQVENMVLNPSFEEFEKCPQSIIYDDQSHRLIPGWTYPSFTTPDYFNKCSTGEVKVPNNFAGSSQPKSGSGYMGAILSGTNRNYREYMQGSLSSSMKEGQVYCVSFWFKLASGSKFAVDQLSIYFVETQIASTNRTFLNYKPQLNNKDGLFLDNTNEWVQFCQLYTAKGGESYFLVGNFKNYDNTNYVVTGKDTKNKKGKQYAYYYFDDFEIRPLVDCNVCACVPKGMETVVIDSFYTGGLDPVTGQLPKRINDGVISLGISGGSPPYNINWSNGMKNKQRISNLPAGIYSYEVTDQNNCRSKGTIEFIEPVAPDDPFKDGLRNIEVGAALILNNIFFETGKSTMLPESYTELDKIVDFLNEGTVSLIEISGHTDNTGSLTTNENLSKKRAEEVISYLVSKGIAENRLQAAGYGPGKPIDTNETPEGRTQNRRVEFLVLKK